MGLLSHRHGMTLVALFCAAALAVAVTGAGRAAAEELVLREVALEAGFNQVLYTGPETPAESVAAELPALTVIFRWDSEAQRYERFSTTGAPSDNDLDLVAPGDPLWVHVSEPSLWRMALLERATARQLYPGWNLVGWVGPDTDAGSILGRLADRLAAAYVLDRELGAFRSYTGLVPVSEGPPAPIAPFDILWLQLEGDDVVSWPAEDEGAGEAGPALAHTVDDVERAVVHVQSAEDAGAGFIVSATQILTAAHVVKEFDTVVVRFPGVPDAEKVFGTVVAREPALDIAVVEVTELPAGALRLDWESAPRPSLATRLRVWGFPYESRVVAAGFEMAVSVSEGIVSARRTRDGLWFLQTDAAVNPGNSGGPVTTLDGRVVGLSSSVFTVNGQDAEGLNLAVDLTQHREDVRSLLASGGG